MKRALLALLLLAGACGGSETTQSEDPKPALSEGPALNLPSEQSAAPAEGQAQLSSEQRAEFEGLVRGFLDSAQQHLAQGYTPVPGLSDEVAGLQPGHDHRWQVALNAGASYFVLGACDNECTDLDIEIIDQRGAVVASDLSDTDFPQVSFTPASAGIYTVRIMMQACSIAPCFAGARVMSPQTI